MEKIYATSTVISDSCMLPKDYSYAVNSSCRGCKFCYKHTGSKRRLYLSKYIDEEAKYSENLYLAPIIISRYCDPFLNETYTKHSLNVAEKMIQNGNQVIFRTDGFGICQKGVQRFISEHKSNIHVQLKCFVENTESGKIIRDALAPWRCTNLPGLQNIHRLIKIGVPVSLFFDPYIIGVNDTDLLALIDHASGFGINKITVKQLFATEYFYNFLSTLIDDKHVNLLSEQVGKYKTYNNEVLLKSFLPFIEKCEEKDINISFCMNKELNQVIGLKYNNCCLLDCPIGIYDLSNNMMYRKKGYNIIRNNDAVSTA